MTDSDRLVWIELKLADLRDQQLASAQYYTKLCEERGHLLNTGVKPTPQLRLF